MSEKSKDEAEKIRANVVRGLARLQNEYPEPRYLLVKDTNLKALVAVLSNAISKINSGGAKEALLDVEAGLNWMIKNSVSLSQTEKEMLLKTLREEK